MRKLLPSLFLGAAVAVAAQSVITNPNPVVTLAWNRDADPTHTYTLYEGVATGQYTNSIPAGTNTSQVVSNLVRGTKYFFAVTATDTNKLQSLFSAEATYTPPVPPGAPGPPSITVVVP